MSITDLDKRAAQLAMDYQKEGRFAAVLRDVDDRGNCNVICPATDMTALAARFQRISEEIFGGSCVARTILEP